MIDQVRASKLPSNMMQFAARGALSVPPDENLEILVYLARHNKVFGDLARMTLAGWDEKASLVAASDPKTAREVLDYLVAPENLRPKLLPALLENPSVAESELAKLAISASPENIAAMLQSARVRKATGILESLRSNPYLKANEAATVAQLLGGGESAAPAEVEAGAGTYPAAPVVAGASVDAAKTEEHAEEEVPEEHVSAYLAEHATEIVAEEGKPFQPIGGIMDLLGADYFPVSAVQGAADVAETTAAPIPAAATASAGAAKPGISPAPNPVGRAVSQLPIPAKRDNSMQKINRLDVKGRIQLALKGNKEERSILIRDGTKVVALAVLEAPKLSDGEVEKFALQKNVLEAVLRQIPLKRRFMKNYIVVRNLVSNPRTPLDLAMGLVKHLIAVDLKNISANKEVSETVRKMALKMYKQKMDAANKK
ncbi:MAG: hypothetical protein WAM04_09300 [Candidatus Sulfotelmatobacter sp.]